MKFETFQEYQAKRKELLAKAEQIVNNAKNNEDLKESEEIRNEINQIDEENQDLVRSYLNKRALNNKNNKVPEHLRFSSNNKIRVGEKMDNLFLNKGDKLKDRVNVKEGNEILNQPGALGNVIKGMVTGQWDNAELKNVVTTTATGVLIPDVLSANIIDLARDISLFTNAGVPVVPMETDNMTISRIKKDPILGFKAEGKEGKQGSFELDSVKLAAKTVYGYAYITIEAIKSSQNLDAIVRQVFAQAIANTIDKAFLYGEKDAEGQLADYAPTGIMNDKEINSVVAANEGYDDFIKAIGKIRKANGSPIVYGINADTEEKLGLLKDSTGMYLEKPKPIEVLTEIVSNQLNSDEEAGSDAIVFDPNALLVGIQNNIQIKIIEDSECLKKGLVGFQIYSMLDCKSVQPKHICKITGIK